MVPFLIQNAARIAAWVPAISLVLVIACLAVLITLQRMAKIEDSGKRKRRWLRLLATNGLGLGVAGLIVSLGPMQPLMETSRQLDQRIGTAVPDMEFQVVADGAVRRLSDFQGHVVVINLWATWCPPCRNELPTLNQLQARYRDRGLVVVTLTDEPADSLGQVVKELAPDTLNGRVDSFGWLAIKDFRPFTLILDRDGVLRDYLFGEQSFDALERRMLPFF